MTNTLTWQEEFKKFLATLTPEEAMKPTKYEVAFKAGWEAALKSKGK